MVNGAGFIADRLSGKRCALIGFDPDKSAVFASLLESAMAFTRAFKASEIFVQPELMRPFDLIAVYLSDQTDLFIFDILMNYKKPSIFMGLAERLIDLFPSERDINFSHDFLIDPWNNEEFFFRVNRVLGEAAESSRRSAEEVKRNKIRVVSADDDPTITALIAAALNRYGIECFIAKDGGQALEKAKEIQPDVMVLDVNMPHMDGFEVLSALKKDSRTESIPVVMLTSRRQEADVMRGFGLGADDYVVKPFNPMELVARIKRLLGK